MTLEKHGYRVVTAFDGVAAIKEIAAHNPALILMDINMPRLDGYQLCKLVKKHPATSHIPVLMLSGKDGMFDKLRGKLVGASGYITKPFSPEGLIEVVSRELKAVSR
ncbi:MAG: response regulator [Planctomycetota bacterium]|nr:MAG: response regulator [Planctomycetota bacterium]